MKTSVKRIFCILSFLSFAQISQASPLFSLVGDENHASTQGQQGKWGLGGGVLMELPLAEYWGFELGGLDVPRTLNQVGTLNYVEVPIELRYWLCHHVVIGAGGYFAKSMGDSTTFSNAGIKTSDYGALASIGVQKHVVPGFAVLLEGRYNYSLNNIDSSQGHWSEMQVLFGFRIGMMAK